MAFAFGSAKPVDQKEQLKKWKGDLKKEQRSLGRECRKIEREEQKAKLKLKELAKKGATKAACVPLAKEIVRSEKARNRLIEAQTRINSVILTLQTNAATVRVAGTMQKSTQVMTAMNKLVSVPQLKATAMAMSKEMMKAGIVSDMVDDTFESLDDEETEEQAEMEVDKVIDEITQGQFSKVGMATKKIKETETVAVKEDTDEKEMKDRLAKLSS